MKKKESPFPGPVPIERKQLDGKDIQNLFGRDTDVDQLTKLLIAERIVLLYSPSGAGKTSLIQAGLISTMEKEDFGCFPIFRAERTEPAGSIPKTEFVRRLLTAIKLDPDAASKSGGFAKALQEYCSKESNKDTVLVLDQFEQLVTADNRFQEAVTYFFEEVGAALSSKKLGLWMLVSIREDFVALLDSYLQYFPNALRARYRLNYLKPEGAQKAIEVPAKRGGVPFAPGVALQFVDNLRSTVQKGSPGTGLDRYVDPFQLQIACLDLWNRLPSTAQKIDQAPSPDEITASLGNYFSSRVASAAQLAGIEENVVRDWFEKSLMDSRGFRIQSSGGPAGDAVKDADVLKSLEEGYLIQTIIRGSRTWYELTHDRLVEPVLESNRLWRISHLDDFQKRALAWERDKSNYLLYRGEAFKEAERWVNRKKGQLTPTEAAFWKACQADRKSLQLKASRNNLLVFAGVLLIGFVGLVLFSKKQWDHAKSRNFAVAASSIAESDPEGGILLGLVASEIDRSRAFGVVPVPGLDTIQNETKYALNSALQQARLNLRIADSALGPSDKQLHAVAFAPVESKELVVAGPEGNVHVVNGITGEILYTGQLSQKERTSLIGPVVVFSGSLIAAASDSSVKVDVVDWREKTQWECKLAREGEVYGLAFDSSGRRLAAATSSGISVWRVAPSSSEINSVKGGTCEPLMPDPATQTLQSTVSAVSFLSDGQFVSAHKDTDGSVYLWDKDLSHPQLLSALGVTLVKSLAVGGTPDHPDSWIGFATPRGPLIFDRISKQLLMFPRTQQISVNAVVFSHDGHLFSTATDEGRVNVWTTTQLGLTDTLLDRSASTPVSQTPRTVSSDPVLSRSGTEGPVHSLSFSSDSQLLAAAGGDDAIRVWSVTALRSEMQEASYHISSDGKFLATIHYGDAGSPSQVVIRDVDSDLESPPLPCNYCRDVAFSENGARLSISGGGLPNTTDPQDLKRGVQVYGIQGLLMIGSFKEWYAYQSSLSADGKVLAALGVEGIHVWNTVQGNSFGRKDDQYNLTGTKSPASAIALSPDNTYLAAGAEDGSVNIWNLSEPDPRVKELGQVEKHFAVSKMLFGHRTTRILGFSRNTDLLAVADDGGNVTIWDVRSGRKKRELPVTFASNQGPRIHGLAFSRQLGSLAVAADDGVKLWRLSGHPSREVLYGGPIYSVAFARNLPDDDKESTKLVGVDGNGRMLTWIVNDHDLEDVGRQRVTKSIEDSECQVYLGTACPAELAEFDAFVAGRAFARAHREDDAKMQLRQAARSGFLGRKTVDQAYNEFRAAALREKAQDEQGDLSVLDRAGHVARVKQAVSDYVEAAKLDPAVPTTAAIAEIAESLASLGKVSEAIGAYHSADRRDSKFFNIRENSRFSNNVCWGAAMAKVDAAKLKEDVLPICDRAVKVEDNNPGTRDSRGIVRALIGDINGAVADEKAFVNWTGKQWDRDRRNEWIKCIDARSVVTAVCNENLVSALRERYVTPKAETTK